MLSNEINSQDSSALNKKRGIVLPNVKIYYKDILNKLGRETDKWKKITNKDTYVEEIGR